LLVHHHDDIHRSADIILMLTYHIGKILPIYICTISTSKFVTKWTSFQHCIFHDD